MIRFAIGCLSVFVFMLGSLILLGASAAAWLWIVATCARETHWSLAAALFLGTLWLAQRFPALISSPWALWHQVWLWADGEIERRIGS